MHCYAKGTNCLSLKIVVSLSKSASITFLAPVCEHCSLFFLQAQLFLNNTLVIKESKYHLSDSWLLPAKLYGLSWWYYFTFEDIHTGKKSENGKLWKDANNLLCSPYKGQEGPEGRQRYSPNLSVTSALDRSGWSMPHTSRFAPGKEAQSPLYRGLGGHQGQSGQVLKIMPLPGFDPWTAQPLASHYTNYAITIYQVHYLNTFAFWEHIL